MKKKIIKISSFLNGSSSFRIKISEKNKTKFLNYFLLKNFSESLRNDLDYTLFSSEDLGSGSASKLNES